MATVKGDVTIQRQLAGNTSVAKKLEAGAVIVRSHEFDAARAGQSVAGAVSVQRAIGGTVQIETTVKGEVTPELAPVAPAGEAEALMAVASIVPTKTIVWGASETRIASFWAPAGALSLRALLGTQPLNEEVTLRVRSLAGESLAVATTKAPISAVGPVTFTLTSPQWVEFFLSGATLKTTAVCRGISIEV